MHARLDEGMWAVHRDGAVHLGILEGDLRAGWHARFGTIPAEDLGIVAAYLNTAGSWTNGRTRIRAAKGMACIHLADGPVRLLHQHAAARLQVLCTIVDRGAALADPAPAQPARVTPRRGGLAIDVAVVGHPLADGAVTADPQGGVRMSVPTSAGPLELLLPALPLLVAAAEATNDDMALRLWGTDAVGADVVVQVPADTARAAAAEAQWLLPGFARRFGEQAV